jgi:hypothetical protein
VRLRISRAESEGPALVLLANFVLGFIEHKALAIALNIHFSRLERKNKKQTHELLQVKGVSETAEG